MIDWLVVPNTGKQTAVWRTVDVLIISASTIVLLVLSAAVITAILGLDAEQIGQNPGSIEGFATWSVFFTAVSFCLPIFIIGTLRRINWSETGWRPISLNRALIDTLIGLMIIPVMGLLSALTASLISDEPFDNPQLDMLLPEGVDTQQMVLLAFLVGIFTPFAEEWLFRGVLHRWIRQYLGFGGGALLSSVIFGLFHAIVPIIIPTAVLGFVCAWAYEKSGSLWSAIIIHAMNNLIQVVALYYAVSNGIPIS